MPNRIVKEGIRFVDTTASLVFAPRHRLVSSSFGGGFYFLCSSGDMTREYPSPGFLSTGNLKAMAEAGEIDVETYELAVAVDMEDRL